mmetsp:Transcript_65024/g.201344  ORF Transcript_65024/g.201344 Transcript_65024/m.201344 type:complete len:127 (-) Transcript_65024:45-425(-)
MEVPVSIPDRRPGEGEYVHGDQPALTLPLNPNFSGARSDSPDLLDLVDLAPCGSGVPTFEAQDGLVLRPKRVAGVSGRLLGVSAGLASQQHRPRRTTGAARGATRGAVVGVPRRRFELLRAPRWPR